MVAHGQAPQVPQGPQAAWSGNPSGTKKLCTIVVVHGQVMLSALLLLLIPSPP